MGESHVTDVYLGVDLNATTFLTLFWKANWIYSVDVQAWSFQFNYIFQNR